MAAEVVLSRAYSEDVVLNYGARDLPENAGVKRALAPGDYTQIAAETLTITAGQTSATFTVNINDDDMYEFDEDFEIFLEKNVRNVSLGRTTATVSIRSEDLPPVAGIYPSGDADISITEGEAAVFTVTVSAPFSDNENDAPTNVSVLVTQRTGDYLFGESSSLFREVVFAPNETAATLTILTEDDLTAEMDGQLKAAVLTDGESRWLVDGENNVAFLSVLDNETPEIRVERSFGGCSSAAFGEGVCAPVARYILSRPAPEGGAVFRQRAVENGVFGADIVVDGAEGERTLTIEAGQTETTMEFGIRNDNVDEQNTTLTVSVILPPAGYVTGSESGSVVYEIEDNDGPPAGSPRFTSSLVEDISAQFATENEVSEGEARSFEVRLSAPSQNRASLRISTRSGASRGNNPPASSDDYVAFDEVIEFPPGVVKKTVSIQTAEDEVLEPDEAFQVVFSDLVNVTGAPPARFIVIKDDDKAVGISTPLAEITEADPGGNGENIQVVLEIPGGLSSFRITDDFEFHYTVTETGLGDHISSDDEGMQTLTYDASTHIGDRVTAEIPVTHDLTHEGDSVVTVALDTDTLPEGFSVSTGRERFEVRIINDDPAPADAPVASLSVEPAGVNENSDIVGTITLSKTTYTADVVVGYGARDGPDGAPAATSPEDFIAETGALTFTPGAPASQTFTITVNDDEIHETDENVEIFLTNPLVGAHLGDGSSQVVTILANDSPALLSIAPAQGAGASVYEGEPAVWTVAAERALSAVNEVRVPVLFAESGNGSYQFGEAPTEAVFPAGANSAQLIVNTADDNTTEEDNIFRITLSDDTAGATRRWFVSERFGEITVKDNELPTIEARGFSDLPGSIPAVIEGESITFSFVLSEPLSEDFAVPYTITELGVSDHIDAFYENNLPVVVITAGSNSALGTLPTDDDNVEETNGVVRFDISEPPPGYRFAPGGGNSVFVTVQDNDDLPAGAPTVQLSAATYTFAENVSGGVATFTATLSAASANTASVRYTSFPIQGDGSTAGADDYEFKATPVLFEPGETAQTFDISIFDDSYNEGDETFNVALVRPHGATLGTPNAAVVTIADDDTEGGVVFLSADSLEGREGGVLLYKINAYPYPDAATNPYHIPLIHRDTSSGTDFSGFGGTDSGTLTVTFASQVTEVTEGPSILADGEHEPPSFLILEIGDLTGTAYEGYTITNRTLTFTILDGDPAPTGSPTASFARSLVRVEEDAGTAEVDVILSSPAGVNGAQVGYSTSPGTAQAPGDYTAVNVNLLTFERDNDRQTLSIDIIDDDLFEMDEEFTVTFFEQGFNANPTPGDSVTVVIAANDRAPEVRVRAVNDDPVNEGEEARFTATASRPLSATESTIVPVSITQGSSDFLVASIPTEITFPPNATTVTFGAFTENDTEDEDDGVITAWIHADTASPPGLQKWLGAGVPATVAVLDDDLPVTGILTLSNTAPSEGSRVSWVFFSSSQSARGGALTYTISETGPGNHVPDSIENTPRTHTFELRNVIPGFGFIDFLSFDVEDDQIHEGDSEVTITVMNVPEGFVIHPTFNEHVTAIRDNDPPPAGSPQVMFATRSYTVDENVGGGEITAQVVLSANSANPVIVGYQTEQSTATAGEDFTHISGTLTFTPEQLSRFIRIPIIDNDLREMDETFTVRLLAADPQPLNATLGSPDTVEITIEDDEGAQVFITAGGEELTEGQGVILTLSALPAPVEDYSFYYHIIESGTGDHVDPVDRESTDIGEFQPSRMSSAVSGGTGRLTLTLLTQQDDIHEGESVVTVVVDDIRTVSSSSTVRGYGFENDGFSVVKEIRIFDNDPAPAGSPVVSFSRVAYGVDEPESASIGVSLSKPAPAGGVSVDYRFTTTGADGMSLGASDDDFSALPGTLTFSEGEQSKTIQVGVVDDDILEPDESFDLILSNPVNALFSASNRELRELRSSVIIRANDIPEPVVSVEGVNAAGVTEGENAHFLLRFTPQTPPSGLTVNLRVSQRGDILPGGEHDLTIAVEGLLLSHEFSIPTMGGDTYSGTAAVLVEAEAGEGYGIGAGGEVAVNNDDIPVVRLAGNASPVYEGGDLVFTVLVSNGIMLESDLTVHIAAESVPAGEVADGALTGAEGFVDPGTAIIAVIPSGSQSGDFIVPTINHYGSKGQDGAVFVEIRCNPDESRSGCAQLNGGHPEGYGGSTHYSFADLVSPAFIPNDNSEAVGRVRSVPRPVAGIALRGSENINSGQNAEFTVTVDGFIPLGGIELGFSVNAAEGTVEGAIPAIRFEHDPNAAADVRNSADLNVPVSLRTPSGTLAVSLADGTGYAVGAMNSASVNVTETYPILSVESANMSLTEGGTFIEPLFAEFIVRSHILPPVQFNTIPVRFNISESSFISPGRSGDRQRTFAFTEQPDGTFASGIFTVPIINDTDAEPAGEVVFTLLEAPGNQYGLSLTASENTASVAVRDDDSPDVGVTVSVFATEKEVYENPYQVVEFVLAANTSAPPAGLHTSANAALPYPLPVNVEISHEGDFIQSADTGAKVWTIPAGERRAVYTIPVIDDLEKEENGAVVATITADASYAVSATGANSASVIVLDDESVDIDGGLGVISTDALKGSVESDVITFREGSATRLTVTLTFDKPATETGAVSFSTQTDTARDCCDGTRDYRGQYGNLLTFSPGDTEVSARVEMTTNGGVEETEEFTFSFLEVAGSELRFNPDSPGYDAGGARATISGRVFILDQTTPTVSVAARNSSVTEGGDAGFIVYQSGTSARTVAYNLEFAGSYNVPGSAVSGLTAQIPSGMNSASFSVSTHDDSINEPDGSVTVSLMQPSDNAFNVGSPATVRIIDNDTPVISLAASPDPANTTVKEGGFVEVALTASRTAGEVLKVPVNLVAPGTEGGDYIVREDGYILPGETTARVRIRTGVDFAEGTNREVRVSIAEPHTGAGWERSAAHTVIFTIEDDTDDIPRDFLNVQVSDATVVEGGNLEFVVSVAGRPGEAVTVGYHTVDIFRQLDWSGFSAPVRQAGQLIEELTDRGEPPALARGINFDQNEHPTYWQDFEYASDRITLTLDAGDPDPATPSHGRATHTITVRTLGDRRVEPDEFLTLRAAGAYGVFPPAPSGSRGEILPVGTAGSVITAVGTIVDNDAWTISTADVHVEEGDSGTTPMLFTVSIDPPITASGTNVFVNYSVLSGGNVSASAYGEDWRANRDVRHGDADWRNDPDNGIYQDYSISDSNRFGALTFGMGDTVRTVSVDILGDTRAEPDETIQFALSGPHSSTGAEARLAGLSPAAALAIRECERHIARNPSSREAIDCRRNTRNTNAVSVRGTILNDDSLGLNFTLAAHTDTGMVEEGENIVWTITARFDEDDTPLHNSGAVAVKITRSGGCFPDPIGIPLKDGSGSITTVIMPGHPGRTEISRATLTVRTQDYDINTVGERCGITAQLVEFDQPVSYYKLDGNPALTTSSILINDPDGKPVINLSGPADISEGETSTFTVSAHGVLLASFEAGVTAANAPGFAYLPNDISRTFTFEPGGEASQTFDIAIPDDNAYLPDGEILVSVDAPSGSDYRPGAFSVLTVTVRNTDLPPPTLNLSGDTDVNEGETVTLTISTADTVISSFEVGVTAANAPGSAYLPNDISRTFTFEPGAGPVSQTFDVAIPDDNAYGPDGEILVSIGASGNLIDYLLGGSSVLTLTVRNTDLPPPTLNLSGDTDVNEGETATLTVSTADDVGRLVEVNVRAANSAGGYLMEDLVRTVTFEPGAGPLTKTFDIAIPGDNAYEPDGAIVVSIESDAGRDYRLGTTTALTLTVRNTDLPPPTLNLSGDTDVNEGETATLTVSTADDVGRLVEVNVRAANSAGGYLMEDLVRTVTFEPGAGPLTQTFDIAIPGDNAHEPDGAIVVSIESDAGRDYRLGTITALTLTVRNTDLPPPTLNLSGDTDVNEGETVTLTVSTADDVGRLVEVNVRAANAAGSYLAEDLVRTVTFEPGAGPVSQTFDITVPDNDLFEYEGRILVSIEEEEGRDYRLGTATALTLAVRNNDVPKVTLSFLQSEVHEGNPFYGVLASDVALKQPLALAFRIQNVPAGESVGDGKTAGATGFVSWSGGVHQVIIPIGETSLVIGPFLTQNFHGDKEGDGYYFSEVVCWGGNLADPPVQAAYETDLVFKNGCATPGGGFPPGYTGISWYSFAEAGDDNPWHANDPSEALIRIIDVDPPEMSVRSAAPAINPGTPAVFTVNAASQIPVGGLTVGWSAQEDTSGIIDGATSGTVTFDYGVERIKNFSVNTMAGAPMGTITATLDAPPPNSQYTVSGTANSATVNIVSTPALTVSGADITEADGTATFTVASGAIPIAPLAVRLTIGGGEGFVDTGAYAGEKTLTLTAATAVYEIPVMTDDINEPDGLLTATLALNPGEGYVLGAHTTATIAITDDDTPELTIAAAETSVTEAEGAVAEFTISTGISPRGSPPVLDVKVTVTETGDNSPSDFVTDAPGGNEGTKTFALDFTGGTATLTVPLAHDEADEFDGTLTVEIAAVDAQDTSLAAQDYTIGTTAAATVRLVDDDVPVLRVAAGGTPPVAEADGAVAAFTISADKFPKTPPEVVLTVAETGDFVASGDKGTDTVTLTFTPDGAGGTYNYEVAIVNDDVTEVDGDITLTIAENPPWEYDVDSAMNVATVQVEDDESDIPLTVGISGGADITEGAEATFTLTLNRASLEAVPVGIRTENATGDYLDSPQTRTVVTIPPNVATYTFGFATDDDMAYEADGSVRATVLDEGGYGLGSPSSATVNVADNDIPQLNISAPSPSEIVEGTDAVFTVSLNNNVTPMSVLTVQLTVGESGATMWRPATKA